jgi:hypothetical protein
MLPQRSCIARCAERVEMPMSGSGYVNIRRDGEDSVETSASYLRRDLTMLVQYAAAKVACKAADWHTGNGGPIALGDMSQRDGSIPGTVWREPRHPPNTHLDGLSIDIAYFQTGTVDNHLRPICRHRSAAGVEEYRCVEPPTGLDAWRTALFIGAFLEEPRIRAIGVDGRAARPILAAFRELCATGWIEKAACHLRNRIRFETRDTGQLWFYGHHNHLHVSWLP